MLIAERMLLPDAGRVEKIDDVVQQLKAGDLKLRVRALELERAARRSSILQVCTIF